MVNKFPKINFFAYVINYDVFGESQGSAAIANLGIGIKKNQVILNFNGLQREKITEIGIDISAWETIKKAIDIAIDRAEENEYLRKVLKQHDIELEPAPASEQKQ